MENTPTERVQKLWTDIYLAEYMYGVSTAQPNNVRNSAAKAAADRAALDFIDSIKNTYHTRGTE